MLSGRRDARAGVLSRREAAVFECLADTLLAPAPPLPPVRDTDALEGFDEMLRRSPKVNRVALRAVLLGLLAVRWPRRNAPRRLALVRRVERLGPARQLVDAVRSAVAVSYYGDAGVQRLLGYDP